MKDECKCLANCEDVNYVVEEFDVRLWFLGSNCQFGLKTCPRMRLKRDLIFGFTDVLGLMMISYFQVKKNFFQCTLAV